MCPPKSQLIIYDFKICFHLKANYFLILKYIFFNKWEVLFSISAMNFTNGTHPRQGSNLYHLNGPQILAITAGSFISTVGVLINSVAFISIVKYANSSRREASTRFVLNLILSDFVFCLITVPLYWSQPFWTKSHAVGDLFCNILLITYYWTFEVGILSLCLVSINRLVFS